MTSNAPSPMPETLTLETTTLCNLSCPGCFALADTPRGRHMEFPMALAIAREAREMGIVRLHLTGGEPLLWPHLQPFLEEALRSGFASIHINTNGDFLSARILDRFRALPAIRLTVSLNGPEPIHDAMRGRGTCFRARRALAAALEAGIPVDAFTVVSRPLLPRLPEFARDLFARFPRLGQWVLIQVHRNAGDTWTGEGELLGADDLVRLARFAGMLSLAGFPVGFLDNPLASAASRQAGLRALADSPARIRTSHIAVLRDSTITASHSHRVPLGRYRPGALRHAFQRLVEAERAAGTACVACRHRAACARMGIAQPSDPALAGPGEEPLCRQVMDRLQASSPAMGGIDA